MWHALFLQVATNTCKSLGISDSDLHSCIYDVAITNDTSFTDQEGFKKGMLSFTLYFDQSGHKMLLN